MVRIKLRTKLLRSTTVYMFVRSLLCSYAKSLLLMARAANLLSLHLFLVFNCSNGTFLSIASLMTSNVDPLRDWNALWLSQMSRMFAPYFLLYSLRLHPHSGAYFQMEPWRNASDQVPGKWLCQHHLERLFHPAMLVTIFWLHCSYSRESGQYSQPWPNTNFVRLCLIFNHHCLLQLVKSQWIKLSNWLGSSRLATQK